MTLAEKPDFDHEKIKQAVRLMFEAIGENPERPVLQTPPTALLEPLKKFLMAANTQTKKSPKIIRYFLIIPQPES